jgi:FixJ family two-component response regulator
MNSRLPKRKTEHISHRLGSPALRCREPSPTLPIACRRDQRGRRHDGAKKVADAVMRTRTLISIVEDDEPFRESMRQLVTSLGYTVEAFASVADFLASPLLSATACLVTDVQMPGMTGIELHRHLIDADHPIPTILVTAYPDEVARRRAMKDGVVCYLCKPVDDDHLERCLRSALESGKPHAESS